MSLLTAVRCSLTLFCFPLKWTGAGKCGVSGRSAAQSASICGSENAQPLPRETGANSQEGLSQESENCTDGLCILGKTLQYTSSVSVHHRKRCCDNARTIDSVKPVPRKQNPPERKERWWKVSKNRQQVTLNIVTTVHFPPRHIFTMKVTTDMVGRNDVGKCVRLWGLAVLFS